MTFLGALPAHCQDVVERYSTTVHVALRGPKARAGHTRAEQEQRAVGNFSWNTGINYTELLDASGRRGLIEELYAKAGSMQRVT